MSDPCLSGLMPEDCWSQAPDDVDFHNEDDETPMVTLRLEMEHPSGDEDLTVFAEVQVDPEVIEHTLNHIAFYDELVDGVRDAIYDCGGYETWLNDPQRAQAIWRAHEKPGGTA